MPQASVRWSRPPPGWGADGDEGLALNLLWLVAQRCFWADPGKEARECVIATAERMHVDEGDLRLLAILAYAAPVERGRVVFERLSRSASDAGGDAAATRLLDDLFQGVGSFLPPSSQLRR